MGSHGNLAIPPQQRKTLETMQFLKNGGLRTGTRFPAQLLEGDNFGPYTPTTKEEKILEEIRNSLISKDPTERENALDRLFKLAAKNNYPTALPTIVRGFLFTEKDPVLISKALDILGNLPHDVYQMTTSINFLLTFEPPPEVTKNHEMAVLKIGQKILRSKPTIYELQTGGLFKFDWEKFSKAIRDSKGDNVVLSTTLFSLAGKSQNPVFIEPLSEIRQALADKLNGLADTQNCRVDFSIPGNVRAETLLGEKIKDKQILDLILMINTIETAIGHLSVHAVTAQQAAKKEQTEGSSSTFRGIDTSSESQVE